MEGEIMIEQIKNNLSAETEVIHSSNNLAKVENKIDAKRIVDGSDAFILIGLKRHGQPGGPVECEIKSFINAYDIPQVIMAIDDVKDALFKSIPKLIKEASKHGIS